MKIILDGFGGDNSPDCVVEGAVQALNKYNDLELIICGKEEELKSKFNNFEFDNTRLEILPANTVISNNEAPSEAIRVKKDSSLVVGFERLKNDDECVAMISAGSTGAVLAGALLRLGRIKGINRPALAPLIPNKKGGYTLIIDCGANVDCKVENLEQFALMGEIYFSATFGIEKPKIALLNVGVEDKKGNEFSKEVFAKLKELPINFVGNMEARDLTSGNYDVVVCDGFNGNVLLKATEGASMFVLSEIKSAVKSSFVAKIGALLMKRAFKKLRQRLDYNKYGGSPFLGCKKTVIKSHGSSTSESILAAVTQAINLENNKVNENINNLIEKYTNKGE